MSTARLHRVFVHLAMAGSIETQRGFIKRTQTSGLWQFGYVREMASVHIVCGCIEDSRSREGRALTHEHLCARAPGLQRGCDGEGGQ